MDQHSYGEELDSYLLVESIEKGNSSELANKVYPGRIAAIICELINKDEHHHLLAALKGAYGDSYRKDYLISESVVIMTASDGIIVLSEGDRYDCPLTACLCEELREQVNRLHICGGLTPIHEALTKSTSMMDILVSHGADINSRDRYGATPLHHAAWTNSKHMCQELLRKGADTSLKDKSGRIPLEMATAMRCFEIAKLLTGSSPKAQEIFTILEQNQINQFEMYEAIYCDGDQDQLTNCIKNIPSELNFDSFITVVQKSSHGSQSFAMKTPDVEKLKDEVEKLMKRISEIVEESDPRFKFAPVMTGSMKQGGKVCLPDEFDYNCILVEFSKLCKDVAEDDSPGFCKIIKITDTISDEYSEYFDEDGHLDMTSVNKVFYLLIERALLKIYLHESDVTHDLMLDAPGRRMVLPKVAHELHLRWNSSDIKNMKIKIDVASVLHFKAQSADIVPYSGLDTALFIPIRQTWMNDKLRRLCRLSTTLQENAAFDTFNDQMKEGYGLLKTLLSFIPPAKDFAPKVDYLTLNGSVLDKKPTTYHLKLALIRVVLRAKESDNSCEERDRVYWAREAIAELIARYTDGVLTTPWNPEHNVLQDYKLKRDQWNLLEQSTIDLSFMLLKAYAKTLSNIVNQQNTGQQQTVYIRKQAAGIKVQINMADRRF